jgi:hypothetical protein
MKMRLKGCRRCGGDMFPDGTDREGRTLTCLQCGLEVRFRVVAATDVGRPGTTPPAPVAA